MHHGWGHLNFWPLGEVHGDQEVSVSPVTLWEGSSDVDGDFLEGCSSALICGSGPSAGCTSVTLMTPPVHIIPQVQPVVTLPDCQWTC